MKKEATFRFLDSYKFMSDSLDRLVNNSAKSRDLFPSISSTFPNDNDFNLCTIKGVFSYEYLDSLDRLKEKQLPPKKAFNSSLNNKSISDEEYEFAKKVFSHFNMKDLGEYHDYYLKLDTLLLADVFQNFREQMIKHYKLDPLHYHTLPGYAWDVLLRTSKVELELLTDYGMLLMIESGIRGGICQAVHRYAEANNKYLDDYDRHKESTFLQYLDANNLYGWAMSKYLPTGGFKWISPAKYSKIMWEYHEKSEKGYILDVDIRYPTRLHKEHNDLPFCPEHMSVSGGGKKLVPNLADKENYVIHIENLKQAIENGLEVVGVNRIIEFDQRPWMADYIEFNTKLRMKAKNKFEQNLFKLMNNSVFGKTMENIRKRVNVDLVTNDEQYKKIVNKPEFKSSTRLSPNFRIMRSKVSTIKTYKPIYVGFCILELSKTLMYDFHYKCMKPKYGKDVKLCYMDTDSFVYHIKTDDFYTDIAGDVREKFDTSEYTKNYLLEIGLNHKMLGLMKDELKDKEMKKFIALRAKLYSYIVSDGSASFKHKGVKNCVRKVNRFDNYFYSLVTKEKIKITQTAFRSRQHCVYTERITKVGISANDDKRTALEDGIHTLAHGYNYESD